MDSDNAMETGPHLSQHRLQCLVEEVQEMAQKSHIHATLTGIHIQRDAGRQGHLLVLHVLGMLRRVGFDPIQYPVDGRVAHDDEPIG